VRRLVAKAAGRPASAVTLASGATTRLKTLLIADDPSAVAAALAENVRRKA
jgi:uncharacterized protein